VIVVPSVIMAVQWQRESMRYASWTLKGIAEVANPKEIQAAHRHQKSIIVMTQHRVRLGKQAWQQLSRIGDRAVNRRR
jgi:hypothetical protein